MLKLSTKDENSVTSFPTSFFLALNLLSLDVFLFFLFPSKFEFFLAFFYDFLKLFSAIWTLPILLVDLGDLISLEAMVGMPIGFKIGVVWVGRIEGNEAIACWGSKKYYTCLCGFIIGMERFWDRSWIISEFIPRTLGIKEASISPRVFKAILMLPQSKYV